MFNKKKKNNKGFTLVELLVVIAIIGILAVVAVPSLFKQIDKAKATQVVTNVKALKTEILTEYADASDDDEIIATMNEGNILSILELGTNQGKLGESYSVVDDSKKEEDKVVIRITCTGAPDKAKIIADQLGITITDKAVSVDYPVGKK